MTQPSEVTTAVELFEAGHACSQAILAAFADRFDLSRDVALKMASSLAGGMGGQGLACGAVTGALLVIGLHSGRVDPDDQATRDRNDELVKRLFVRFQEAHGSLVCNELIGIDMTDLEQKNQAKDDGVFERVCPDLVRRAAEITLELITED